MVITIASVIIFFLDMKQNVEEEDFVLFDKILIIIAWIN